MISKDEFESLYVEALERLERAGKCPIDLTDVFEEIVNEKQEREQVRELIEKFQERSDENDQ